MFVDGGEGDAWGGAGAVFVQVSRYAGDGGGGRSGEERLGDDAGWGRAGSRGGHLRGGIGGELGDDDGDFTVGHGGIGGCGAESWNVGYEIGGSNWWGTRTSEIVEDFFPLADGALLAHPDRCEPLAAVLAALQFADVVLDALLGDQALDFLGGALGIGDGDLVLVDTRGSLFQEASPSSTKRWRVPVHPAVVLGEDKCG